MQRHDFLRKALRQGLLLTAAPAIPSGGDVGPEGPLALAEFHALPIYRCYVRASALDDGGEGLVAELTVPQPLDLVRDPSHPRDRRAIAVYAGGERVGHLPPEDGLLLGKLTRRGLPVACRLIGVQPAAGPSRRLSAEVALLYPPHPATDAGLERQEAARLAGLAQVARKPPQRRYLSGDPLSAGHVYDGYYDGAAGVAGFVG